MTRSGVVAIGLAAVLTGVGGHLVARFSEAVGGPLLIESRLVDLGRLVIGQRVSARVRVTNPGPSLVAVSDFVTGCACVAHINDLAPIPPGESAEIVVEIDTTTLTAGPLVRRVSFSTNGKADSRNMIEVTGTLEAEVDVRPPVLDFGEVAQGVGAQRSLSLAALRPGVTFESISTTNPAINVVLHRHPAGGVTATASVSSASPPRAYYGVIIVGTSSVFNPEVRLPVFVTIRPR